MKKKILIITLSDLRYDARVRRQIHALKEEYHLAVAGFSGEPSSDYELISLSPTPLTLSRKILTSIFLLLRMYTTAHAILHDYLPRLKAALSDRAFDLIIANDVEALPLAFGLKPNAKILFDAHEYAPRHFEDKLMWRIFFKDFNTWLCKKYIPLTAGMTTVGKRLADEYEKHFKVRPTVIVNANNYFETEPSPVQEHKIRLVHVGIANPSRKLELMIEMMKQLDSRFSLDLYLLIPGFASGRTKNYIQHLKDLARSNPTIRILPPIKSKEVVQTINLYDVGVFLLPPINFNYENTLPNKLFDFIQARLGVAIGPTLEMAEIVNRYGIGVVSSNFTPQNLAIELNKLTKTDIERFKKNAGDAARDFNAENNAKLLQQIVAQIVSPQG